MIKNTKLAFIGGGVMAEAIIKGLLAKHLADPGQITAAEPRADRRKELEEKYAIHTTADAAAAADAGIIVLSIKPQVMPEVLPILKGKVAREAMVLSIAAGIRLATIVEGLAHPSVVRAMPNTPAQIGEGATVWIPAAGVTTAQREQAAEILERSVWRSAWKMRISWIWRRRFPGPVQPMCF